jgi:predicted DNA-binding transcriptional regulator
MKIKHSASTDLANDRLVGGGILAGSSVGIVIYGLLLVYAWQITLIVTAFLGVALLLGILAWIGYTMATTPPPEPITEIPGVAPQEKANAEGQKSA